MLLLVSSLWRGTVDRSKILYSKYPKLLNTLFYTFFFALFFLILRKTLSLYVALFSLSQYYIWSLGVNYFL